MTMSLVVAGLPWATVPYPPELLWRVFPGLGTQTFGRTGMGGSVGLADPTNRLGFGYVMNQMGNDGEARLLSATYRSLAS